MSEAARPQVEFLEFIDDLAAADVDALRAFLEARLEELRGRLARGSEAHAAATALAAHVTADCVSLSDNVMAWHHYVAQGRENEPGHIQTLHQDISFRWNLLCRTGRSWRDHPEYNPRWRELPYANAAEQEFMESALARHGSSRGPYGEGPHP